MKKIKKIVIFLCLLSFSNILLANVSLADLKSYAEAKQEYPKSDNKDLLNPNYTSFYKKEADKSWFSHGFNSVLCFLHIKRKPFWLADNFKKLLEKVIKDQKKGDSIFASQPKLGSKFVIFGSLHGELHSFTRSLEKLKELGVIDDDLKIIKPDHYFVFNGNIVDHSPYSLEMFYSVLILMEKNPGKVFYIRGDHEAGAWYDNGLRKEIDIRLQDWTISQKDTLKENIGLFFNCLPIAVFLKTLDQDEFVCFSYFDLGKKQLKQERFAQFLKGKLSDKFQKFNLSEIKETKDFASIEAIVKGVDRTKSFIPTQGLLQLPPDQGATAWNVLSASTMPYQKLYKFFYDSFAIVSVGSDIYNWKISLFNRNVKEKESKFGQESYYLVSGQSTDKPPCTGRITVGSTMALTGPISIYGRPLSEGLSIQINKLNKEAGIKGKYIKLIILDDKYKPDLAKSNIEQFLRKFKTNITLSSLGSPTLNNYIPLIKEKKVLVLFPVSGAPIFRKDNLINMIHYKLSYLYEGKALVEYAAKNLNAKRIVLFIQNDQYGEGPFIGAKEGLSKYNIDFIKIPYKRGAIDFKKQVEKTISYKPDAIMFFSLVSAAKEFIKQIGAKNLNNVYLLGISDLSDTLFHKFLADKGLTCVVAQAIPNIKSKNLKIVEAYRKDSQTNNFLLSKFALEGYINSSIFIYILKNIEGEISKEKIIKQIEKIKDYNFKGLSVNFNPKTRSLSNDIWIDTGKDKWINFKV
jgi:ABC-type branched-subunit amino acid transport system substrate-binding protein